ncbi:MAG: restriction endonuclease subunit S [Saprospirales bacterium]|nr:MAG: restriction endonuclease subunit S [Saprospirales bacterium]
MIKNIAQIRYGLNAKVTPDGSIPILQLRDFDEYENFLPIQLSKISKNQVREKDRLKSGDVLFAAKGSRRFSYVWDNELPVAVASSTFFVISIKIKTVIPEYLAWYLQSNEATRYFDKYFKEGTIKSINKKVFEMLEIKIPSIAKQKQIVRLNELFHKELILLDQLKSEKEKLIRNL